MKLKTFQREDYARMALHDGAICGQETGLGKGLCAYIFPLLKVGLLHNHRPITPAQPVLIVAAGDLHNQIISEGLRHFGVAPTLLDSQETFLRLSTYNSHTGKRTLDPRYYLTTYTQLASNGVDKLPEGEQLLRSLPEDALETYFNDRGKHFARYYELLSVSAIDRLAVLTSQWHRLRANANDRDRRDLDEAYHTLKLFAPAVAADVRRRIGIESLTPEQLPAVTTLFTAHVRRQYSAGIGTFRSGIKCIYAPSLADLCQDTFAVVVCDEAVKIKGEDTIIGTGVRQMNPQYRCAMTATPVKNRLPDIFHLAHWVTGAHEQASPRFPFGAEDRQTFAEEFCVSERNLSKEEESETNRRFVKLTPQVCNIHRLWKLLGPIVLRRRFDECGEEVVKQLRHVVRVPMGLHQAAAYKFHLDAEYLDKNGRPATGARLQALRVAAANPSSGLLERPFGDRTKGEPRSNYSFVPKVASALSLVEQILGRGEQVIIFSAFHDSLDDISARLREASVKHLLLDGRTSQAKRGVAAAQFKKGPKGGWPVMLAGVECMSEGHSFDLCQNGILLAYSWAWDKFLQAIKRFHRLTSRTDVNVYSIICERSIDRKLEGMLQEKGDAAELVLDGHLLGENPTEVNLAELLQVAREDFSNNHDGFVDERELIKQWPALRVQLANAMRAWPATKRPFSETNHAIDATIAPVPATVELEFADFPLWQQAA